MGRFVQPEGTRGSLKWIQRAVNEPSHLDALIVPKLDGATRLSWRSPLANDAFAEYRDGTFLEKIESDALAEDLKLFWPNGGPQWDALATSDTGDVLLVEAKAHIDEVFSPRCGAGPVSRPRIEAAINETADFLGAKPHVPWADLFYQLTNRLAHLYFLRKHGRRAWLVLVNFVGDVEMSGPLSAQEWESAYRVVWHVLGVPRRDALSRYIIDVYPHVQSLCSKTGR
jgi:hypothetical protein